MKKEKVRQAETKEKDSMCERRVEKGTKEKFRQEEEMRTETRSG